MTSSFSSSRTAVVTFWILYTQIAKLEKTSCTPSIRDAVRSIWFFIRTNIWSADCSNIVKDTIIFSIVLSSHDEDFTTSSNEKQIAIYKEYHMALAFVATLTSKTEYYQCKVKQ